MAQYFDPVPRYTFALPAPETSVQPDRSFTKEILIPGSTLLAFGAISAVTALVCLGNTYTLINLSTADKAKHALIAAVTATVFVSSAFIVKKSFNPTVSNLRALF